MRRLCFERVRWGNSLIDTCDPAKKTLYSGYHDRRDLPSFR